MTYSLPTLPANYPIPTLVPVWVVVDRDDTEADILEYYDLDELHEANRDALEVGGRVVRDMIEPPSVSVVVTGLDGARLRKTFDDIDEGIAYAKELVNADSSYRRTVPQSDHVLACWSIGRFAIEVIA